MWRGKGKVEVMWHQHGPATQSLGLSEAKFK